MHKLIVRNSAILITDYTLGECEALERNFKIWDMLTHRFNIIGMYYDEIGHILYIPRGLDIWKIKQYLGISVEYKEQPDEYITAPQMMMRCKPRDEEQKEALRFMVGVNEYSDNAHLPQISVNLNTGKGKTYCSIATICYLKIKSIIITGSNTLLNQWKENIKEYTNLMDKDIFRIEGSSALNMILQDKSVRAKQASIYLCTHGTLKSFGDTYGWDKVREAFARLGIGVKVFDEAHTHFANMLMVDFYTNVYKTYYVTATPNRSDWREDKVYQLSIKNVPGIDLFDEQNDPHTSYVAIKYNSRPTAQDISYCRNQYGLDRNKYVSYVIKQPAFWQVMRVVMDLIIKCKGRALLYIGTNDAILTVYNWIATNYPEFIGDIGIFTSLVDKDKKMIEKGKKLILSTTKSAGLGEHINGLKMTVVVAEPFKSEVIARQTLGRTRDPNTMYIELVDMGFRYIRNFYYSKQEVFRKYASDVSDITIDQYELDRRSMSLQKDRELPPGVRCPILFKDDRFFHKEEETKRELKEGIHFHPCKF